MVALPPSDECASQIAVRRTLESPTGISLSAKRRPPTRPEPLLPLRARVRRLFHAAFVLALALFCSSCPGWSGEEAVAEGDRPAGRWPPRPGKFMRGWTERAAKRLGSVGQGVEQAAYDHTAGVALQWAEETKQGVWGAVGRATDLLRDSFGGQRRLGEAFVRADGPPMTQVEMPATMAGEYREEVYHAYRAALQRAFEQADLCGKDVRGDVPGLLTLRHQSKKSAVLKPYFERVTYYIVSGETDTGSLWVTYGYEVSLAVGRYDAKYEIVDDESQLHLYNEAIMAALEEARTGTRKTLSGLSKDYPDAFPFRCRESGGLVKIE